MNCEWNTTFIMALQALLQKIGYNPGAVDGIYGSMTADAVKQFQSNNGINPTGEIDKETCQALMPFFLGYTTYTIQSGDSLYKIANQFGTAVQKIVIANQDINPFNLQVGDEIVIPFSYDVVDTNINYTYDVLENDIKGLQARYPFLEVGTIGESILGRDLYYIRLGTGENTVFYNAAHHGLEWITVPLLMKFTENFLINYTTGEDIQGYDLNNIWENSSIYIVPMVNPDGIDLVLNGLSEDNPYYEDLLDWNNGSDDFSEDWQANNRGVDLNHNYPALWEESKAGEAEVGIFGPGPTRFSGEFPFSEPESKAVGDFTIKIDPRLVLAYHTQGEVIYWNFQNLATEEARIIGERLAEISGYELSQAVGYTAYAGYKDWFIQDFGRPGYTIEGGLGVNPLPISQFDQIYADNEGVLLESAII